MNKVISRQRSYLPPITKEIQLFTQELIASSWNNAELNAKFVDIYDEEL